MARTSNRRPRTVLPPRKLLRVEGLEDRTAPAVFAVTTAADNGDDAAPTPGSLRAALLAANATPDTDFAVDVFEVKKDGSSIALAGDRVRARYRESLRRERLVAAGEVNRYEFRSFNWFSRRLAKGSRLRVVFYSPNSRYWEKNYNGGGEVADESRKDARTAHVTLYQDADHASYLEVPTVPAPAKK